jgi:hypothetical protein
MHDNEIRRTFLIYLANQITLILFSNVSDQIFSHQNNVEGK